MTNTALLFIFGLAKLGKKEDSRKSDLQENENMPKVLIMTKNFARVSREPIELLKQAGFFVDEKEYDFVGSVQEGLKVFQGLIEGSLGSYRRVAELDEPKLPVKYPRTRGYRPSQKENPLNARIKL